MELDLYRPILLVIVTQVRLISCIEHESYLMFEAVQRPINQSIVTNTEQAETLLHCVHKCQRRSSESLYFNDSDRTCYCNNDSDTNKHHDPDQPSIIYGGYKKSQELFKTTDTRAPETSTTESVPQTTALASSTIPEYEDCGQLYEAGYTETRPYSIYIRRLDRHVYVLCLMTEDSATRKPSTVIQRRNVGSLPNFYRNWSEYVKGFGSGEDYGDYWLGLENIAAMTNAHEYGPEIYMVPEPAMPQRIPPDINFIFDEFTLNPDENYRMKLAGPEEENNCLYGYDGGHFGGGQEFSTFDRDNDLNSTTNCAEMLRSAWWFKDCGFQMNGPFIKDGTNAPFMTFQPCWGSDVKLTHTSMLIFKRNVSGL